MTGLFQTPGTLAPTPCVGVCALDPESGYCLGCARSGAEIAAWSAAGEDERRGVWRALPARREQLGFTSWRLPWTAHEIAAFASLTLRERLGRWTLGLPGASLCFDEPCAVETCGNRVIARAGGCGLSLDLSDKAAAFAYCTGDAFNIGLALPKGRSVLAVRETVTRLGPDPAPLLIRRDGVLFDLGLGSPALRVLVRTGSRELLEALSRLCGRPWVPQEMPVNGEPLDLILETGLGRIELTDAGPEIFKIGAPRTEVPGWPLALGFLPCTQVGITDKALEETLRAL